MIPPLVEYSSDSDYDDESGNKPKRQKLEEAHCPEKTPEKGVLRLPLPAVIKKFPGFKKNEKVKDNPEKHEGRIRSFPHETGNWATLVYIPVKLKVIDELQKISSETMKEKLNLEMKPNTEIHISLSKTVVLLHHQIEVFKDCLKEAIASCPRQSVSFKDLNIYVNDEKTRTFLGLTVDNTYERKLSGIIGKVDDVLRDFNLDTFYKDPSFHASISWCLGDKEEEIREVFPYLVGDLDKLFSKTTRQDFTLYIDKIVCKSGNKIFNFTLKES